MFTVFRDVAEVESKESAAHMEGLIKDLGVCPLQDASPRLKYVYFIISSSN